MQAVYVPADDYSDPAPVATFTHLDATIALERSIAEKGIYPAVDPLNSTSRILDRNIVGRRALHHGPGSASAFYSAIKICRISSPSWASTS